MCVVLVTKVTDSTAQVCMRKIRELVFLITKGFLTFIFRENGILHFRVIFCFVFLKANQSLSMEMLYVVERTLILYCVTIIIFMSKDQPQYIL